MRKIVYLVLAVVMIGFSGCNDDDGYSLSNIWLGFGVVQEDGDTYSIVMDNKDILFPVASNYGPGWYNRFENGDRVWINYTILDEELNADGTVKQYYVKVNEIDDILMKGILDITEENADSIGNDPIIVQECWMTDSLLNFKLKYWGYSKIHFLNLVKQPGDLTSESQPIELELRHNANEDDESVPYTAFVSFSLNELRIEGQDSVQFQFTSTDYDGVHHTVEKVFDYSELEE